MFPERAPSEMQDILDQFDVPMFAAEQSARDEPWHFVAVNHAWELCSGLRRADVSGKALSKALPAEEAAWLASRFDECATASGPTCFAEERMIGNRSVTYETSLQLAPRPVDALRVTGISLAVHKSVAPRERSTMAEIRDYAVEADYHLSRMLAYIESEATHQEAGIAALSGIGRSIASLLTDIRRAAETRECLRHGQSPWAAAPVIGAEEAEESVMQAIGRHVLKV